MNFYKIDIGCFLNSMRIRKFYPPQAFSPVKSSAHGTSMKLKTFLLVSITAALLITPAEAVFYDFRIDFYDSAGSASNGGTWNILTEPNSVTNFELFNLTGERTAATINLPTDSFIKSGDTPNHWDGGTLGWMDDAAGDDLFFTDSGTVTFHNLVNYASDWKVEVASAFRDDLVTTNLTINGASADRTYTGDPALNPWPAGTAGRANWLIWDSIKVVSGSSIVIVVDRASNTGGISAIRLSQVPEPATYAALCGLAALGLALGRRRT
jgi:hypothetical protein